MLIETTMMEIQIRLTDLGPTRTPLTVLLRAWWALGKLVLGVLLVLYVAGWVRDIERVRQLQAEPAPPFTVITKYQAWDRIYRRPVSRIPWPSTALVWKR